MATIYTLRRKTFADPNQLGEKKKMSTGAKIAAGVGGTALTAAGTFAAARRGKLNFINKNISTRANKLWKNAGQKLSTFRNGTISDIGKNMKKSALNTELNVRSKAKIREAELPKDQLNELRKGVLEDLRNGVK